MTSSSSSSKLDLADVLERLSNDAVIELLKEHGQKWTGGNLEAKRERLLTFLRSDASAGQRVLEKHGASLEKRRAEIQERHTQFKGQTRPCQYCGETMLKVEDDSAFWTAGFSCPTCLHFHGDSKPEQRSSSPEPLYENSYRWAGEY
eukprot:GFYU01027798.1.p1 GENE.GFYU01027798.1~~GFYU01027798.1.p1  ORF type:complete len:170 (+),score=8.38 GFYU01027798.1:71-511(+)